MDADAIIRKLDLSPHPEGGYYRQTWVAENAGRPSGTCIYFLLKADERSHWHTVDATEIWLFHAGSVIDLRLSEGAEGPAELHRLGPDVLNGDSPQIIVPARWWQTAHAPDGWALVSCTVSPGFSFDGFTLADPGFDIRTP